MRTFFGRGICASEPLACVALATRRAKHLLFCRSASSAVRKNIYLYENRNRDYISQRPASTTRTFRPIVTLTWGGMRWTRERKTIAPARTVKPCGPVPPTLGSILGSRAPGRRRLTSPVLRGDRGAAVQPLRGECRTFR